MLLFEFKKCNLAPVVDKTFIRFTWGNEKSLVLLKPFPSNYSLKIFNPELN